MRRIPGLWGQQLAQPLPLPRGLVALPLASGNLYKRLGLSKSANLNVSSLASTIATPWFDLVPADFKRDNLFETAWRQVSGPAGVVETEGALRARFVHNFGSYGAYAISWRCDTADKYGRQAGLQVDFSLSYDAPPLPPLTATGSPSGMQFVQIDPVTRRATVNFSVTVTSAVYPVEFNWGGGDHPFDASNSATIELPVGASSGINFSPGCTISDDAGRSIVVGAGPFFIYE